MRPGADATMEYDVPVDAWYFDENGNRSMPWCVLLEVALQPCGWLSVYVGCPIVASENVFFRNLDGAGKMTGEVFPGSTVRTHTKVTSVSNVSGIILVSYKIECFVGDRQVCNLTAAFGYFPNMALDAQVGLPTTPEQRTRLIHESPVQIDLSERPEKYCEGPLRLPGPMLLMIDRVTGFWRDEGAAGKGRLRVEKTVKPNDWYFRSHFYSDPVQPGSLGVEQMLQTLQFYVIEENLHDGIEQPYFEPLVLDSHISWKFRGQVRPENKRIISEIEILSVESTADSVTVLANGSLWVDGVRCYEAKAIGVRVRGPPRRARAASEGRRERDRPRDRPVGERSSPQLHGPGHADDEHGRPPRRRRARARPRVVPCRRGDAGVGRHRRHRASRAWAGSSAIARSDCGRRCAWSPRAPCTARRRPKSSPRSTS